MENSPSIQAIDKQSVHQICSGQVVLDLATAVKELIENSLDANADNIEIKIKEYGKELIEVADNGSGIEAKNFEALALKHYTSKLNEFNDLSFVDTFGFRGEALSSLSALSDISITTQHKTVDIGSKLEFDHNGKILKNSSIARTYGTTVYIENIFYTLPVRYKEFHRNFKKDFTKLVHVLYSYSLINSNVRFNCVNIVSKKKNLILSTSGKNNILDIITSIFGATQSKNVIPIVQEDLKDSNLEEHDIAKSVFEEFGKQFVISGYVSKVVHGCGRSSPDRQFFFINKRPCDFPKLSRIVNEAYHLFNRQQYPFILIDISLSKEFVDVNVTPDKRLIMIHKENILFAIIKSTLKIMFEKSATYYDENVDKNISSLPFLPKKIHMENISPNISRNSPLLISTKQNSNYRPTEKLAYSSLTTERFSGSPLEKFRSKFDNNSSLASESHSVKNTPEQLTMKNFFKFEERKRKMESGTSEGNPSKKISFSPYIETNVTNTNQNDKMTELSTKHIDSKPIHYNSIHPEAMDSVIEGGNLEDVTLHPSTETAQNLSESGNSKGKIETSIDENISPRPVPDRLDVLESDSDVEVVCANDESGQQFCKRKRVMAQFNLQELNIRFGKYAEKTTCISTDKSIELSSFRAKIAPTDNKSAEGELQKHVSKDMFLNMEIIGQFNLGFIIAKLQSDLFIIDQHATDEKFNFETLQAKHCLKGQRLIQSIPLELTLVNKSILIDNVEIFKQNGFDFEIQQETDTQENMVKLTKVPSSRNWTFSVSDVEELIFMLSDSPGVMCRPSRVRQMFASRACRSSVMVGTALGFQAMKKLVQHMSEIEHPWNCPHGRPTMRHLVNLQRIDVNE